METELKKLRADYPWPDERPDVKPEPHHGWFCGDTANTIKRYINRDTRLVVELGSWLGLSARHILSWSPTLHLICVDHWKGSEEHHRRSDCVKFMQDDVLHKTFIHNMWKFRERLTAVRESTVEGMRAIAACGLTPDILFVDAAHDEPSVFADCSVGHQLWPATQIVGDDYCRGPVAKAVDRFAEENGLRVVLSKAKRIAGWAVEPK